MITAQWRLSRTRKRLGTTIAVVILTVGLVFILLPYVWLFSTAFKQPVDAFALPPKWIFTPTLQNFQKLFSGPFLRYDLNSVIVTLLSTALALMLGVPAGYALARATFHGQRLITGWFLLSYVTPAIVFILPLFVIFFHLGLINTYPGLVLAYETGLLPFTAWLMRSYFTDIPVELDEAARIDGCTRFQTFLRVNLPVARSGISTVAILAAIGAWGEFFVALILTGSNTLTAPVAVYSYVGIESQDWSTMSAAGLVVVVPIMLATIVAQRGLLRGLSAAAVKG